ncbi:Scopoletin glucosyltransferase [Bertholletia excelsa]
MGTETNPLHVMLLPLMAKGHTLPILDIAKLLASRGVKTTVLTTPANSSTFSNAGGIAVKVVRFPGEEVGLPRGLESPDQVISKEAYAKFWAALELLLEPVKQIMLECHPHALVADMSFLWASDVAEELGIPRLVFTGAGSFPMCVLESMAKHKPQRLVNSDTEPFVVPCLPHEIKLTRLQLPDFERHGLEEEGIAKLFAKIVESYERSFGVIFNSFYELESAYADLCKGGRRKAWHIGPVSLCNRVPEQKARRGNQSPIDYEDCLKWLDSKEPNSVVYVCFGSLVRFRPKQLLEIATALESSEQNFVWVVRKDVDEDGGRGQNWLPDGFEQRNREKCLIIRGWAPQLLILDHESTGGFVTHCGWNSVLEGVASGVAMATWPVSAEQFYNEKLVTEVLQIGIGVGAKEWVQFGEHFVGRDGIVKAVRGIMEGKEAEEMRKRARALGETGRRAVEEGGSSHADLTHLLEELRSHACGGL